MQIQVLATTFKAPLLSKTPLASTFFTKPKHGLQGLHNTKPFLTATAASAASSSTKNQLGHVVLWPHSCWNSCYSVCHVQPCLHQMDIKPPRRPITTVEIIKHFDGCQQNKEEQELGELGQLQVQEKRGIGDTTRWGWEPRWMCGLLVSVWGWRRGKEAAYMQALLSCSLHRHVALLSLWLPPLPGSGAGDLVVSSTANDYAGGQFQRSLAGLKFCFHFQIEEERDEIFHFLVLGFWYLLGCEVGRG